MDRRRFALWLVGSLSGAAAFFEGMALTYEPCYRHLQRLKPYTPEDLWSKVSITDGRGVTYYMDNVDFEPDPIARTRCSTGFWGWNQVERAKNWHRRPKPVSDFLI